MAYTAITTSDLLKQYYEPGIKANFFNKKVLLSKIQKNRSDIYGGSAKCALHIGRNPGVGSRANAGTLPEAGQQSVSQTTIPLKYHYGTTYFSGPDVVNSKSDKGAFARVMTFNMNGLMDDMKADLNRQLFSDGSGILALAAGDQSSTVTAIYPYLWSPADKFLTTVGTRIEVYALTDFLTSNVSTASYVLSTAGTTHTNMYTTSGGIGTSTAGDLIGKYGALQLADATTITQYESMGLWGICSDTNLVGDTNYSFDLANSVTNFTGPEGQSYDYTGPGSAANANRLQGIDANGNAYWRAVVKANGGVPRALSFQLLDQTWGQLAVTNGAETDLLLSTYQVRDKYVDLLRNDRRYVDTKTIDGGFEAVMYKGLPWVVDADCPRGAIFMIDTSMLSLYVGEDFGFIRDGNGNVQFQSSTQDIQTVYARCMMNLGVHCRNRQGVIRDISET